ncbi:MAG: leucine-rich repeat domain-containing protein [Promethearchaeota archaeon]
MNDVFEIGTEKDFLRVARDPSTSERILWEMLEDRRSSIREVASRELKGRIIHTWNELRERGSDEYIESFEYDMLVKLGKIAQNIVLFILEDIIPNISWILKDLLYRDLRRLTRSQNGLISNAAKNVILLGEDCPWEEARWNAMKNDGAGEIVQLEKISKLDLYEQNFNGISGREKIYKFRSIQNGFLRENGKITMLSLWAPRGKILSVQKEIPETLKNFRWLKFLRYSDFNFPFIPRFIFEFVNLRYLSLSSNLPIRLNGIVSNLKKLEVLNLESMSKNGILNIDALNGIGKLENLKKLSLGFENLIEFPLFIRKLKKLEHLGINSSSIKKLPYWIGELKNLKSLNIFLTNIRELPRSIIGLKLENISYPNEVEDWINNKGDFLEWKRKVEWKSVSNPY